MINPRNAKSFGQSLKYHNKRSKGAKTTRIEVKGEKEAIWISHIANHNREEALWQ